MPSISRSIILAAFMVSVALCAHSGSAQSTTKATRTPVLVELFTSEGCSSCPPADALLAHLQRDQPIPTADIIALEEHVDYWDSLGWHDRFSSHQITDRQSQYGRNFRLDDNYTPQMLVDGADQFTGNDSGHALRAITAASRTPKVPLILSSISFDGAHASGTIALPAAANHLPNADLYVAVVQSMASTQVQRGENGGRTLHHVSVLRVLQRVGKPPATPLNFEVPIPTDVPHADLRIVAFLQRSGQGAVLGAVASPPLGGSATAASIKLSQSLTHP